MRIEGKELRANRPEPIITAIEVIPYKSRMDPQEAIDALLAGFNVLIIDFYSTGLHVLQALKIFIEDHQPDQSFNSQHKSRTLYRELSNRLLLLIRSNRLIVRKAPEIGWFKILYPDLNEFLLPFPQVQGLNSAWQWFENGISMPVLDRKIHPYYGTYFPTRFEHLKLFDKWLVQYTGEKKSAIDIGIGCGILSFQMLKHGFEKICGTDSNPNAIISVNEELVKNNLLSNIELFHGDLFANCDLKTELIVFNPPWIPASHDIEGLDKAIYYDDSLYPRFFAEATKHLKADGRLVLLFSNLAQITKSSKTHPIQIELANGGRFQKELFLQKKVGQASKKTKRNQNWRESEFVELWVLKPVNVK